MECGLDEWTNNIFCPLQWIRQYTISVIHPPTEIPSELYDRTTAGREFIRMQLSLTLQHSIPDIPYVDDKAVGGESGEFGEDVKFGGRGSSYGFGQALRCVNISH